MELRWFIGIVVTGFQRSLALQNNGIHMICNQLDLTELTIEKLIDHYQSSRITVTQVVSCYLKNIKTLNPSLNAVIQVNSQALHQADYLDLWRNGLNFQEKPLFGVPILIPDNFATFDEMETTAGSYALLGIKPKKDAHLVTLLRKAGAIILGKTNPSELSGFRFSKKRPGLSERGNQTIHPFDRTREVYGDNPGGAVAVASKLALVALGTSLDGSLSSPASELGIVGLSPSSDVISRDGIIFCRSLDKVGIFANSVQDAVSILNVIATIPEDVPLINDEHDILTLNVNLNPILVLNYNVNTTTTQVLILTLKGTHIGKIDHYFNHASVKNQSVQFDKVFDILKKLGSHTTRVEFQVGDFGYIAFIRQLTELDKVIYEYLHNGVTHTDTASAIFSLDDIVRVTSYNDIAENVNILYLTHDFQPFLESTCASYNKLIDRLFKSLVDLMREYNLTAIAVPGHHPTLAYALPSLLQLPTVTIPISQVHPIPVGLTLFGLPGSDSTLINLAYTIESYPEAKLSIQYQLDRLERERMANLTKSFNEIVDGLKWEEEIDEKL